MNSVKYIAGLLLFISVFGWLPPLALAEETENGFYKEATRSVGLVNNSTDARVLYGDLCVDSEGKPAVFFTKKNAEKKSKRLREITEKDLGDVPCFSHIDTDVWRGTFVGWTEQKWTPYSVDLEFKDGSCIAFRATGLGITFTQWIEAEKVPKTMYWANPRYELELPIEFGRVEGPRDVSHGGNPPWE